MAAEVDGDVTNIIHGLHADKNIAGDNVTRVINTKVDGDVTNIKH